jgi:hypothetical protein
LVLIANKHKQKKKSNWVRVVWIAQSIWCKSYELAAPENAEIFLSSTESRLILGWKNEHRGVVSPSGGA